MARRFEETVQLQRQNLATGFAAGALSLADQLEGFKQQQAASARERAVQRGAATAAEVPLETEIIAGREVTRAPKQKEKRFIGSVEINAHNKALRSAYLASLDNDNREAIANIQLENPDNVIKFNEAVEGYRKGVLATVDPSARQLVAQDLDDKITATRIRVQAATIKEQKIQTSADHTANMESSRDEAFRAARNGDQDILENATLSFLATTQAMLDSDQIEIDEFKRVNESFGREVAEQTKNNELSIIVDSGETPEQGLDNAFKKLEEFEKKVPKGWTPKEWKTYTRGARADLVRKRSQIEAAKIEKSKKAQEALRDFEKASALGFEVSPEETNNVLALVSDSPELEKRFNIVQDVKSFSLMSASNRNSVLAASQTGELEDVDAFGAMASANAEINKMARKDGYSLGVKQGLIEQIPLDITDKESFNARIKQAENLSQHYGVAVSPLSDGEAQSISDNLPNLTAQEKVAMAQTFADSPSIWDQLAGKQAGTFAMAGATGDTELMTSVFKGQELLDNKLVIPIKPLDYINDFNDFVEGVYEADDRKDVLRAAIAHYAQTSDNKDGTYSNNDFEDSLSAVTGGIGKINGFKIELPRGISDDDFEDFIDDIQPETVAELGGVLGLSDERAAELISQGRIRNIKTGQYIVELDGGALFSSATQPFIIEWSDDLAARNQALIKSRRRLTRRERKEARSR